MKVPLAVGIFFIALSVVFAAAARKAHRAAGGQTTPAGKARGRVAIAFAVVGLGLLLLAWLNRANYG